MSVLIIYMCLFCYFFFNDTATTEIYTLSLHDALPICPDGRLQAFKKGAVVMAINAGVAIVPIACSGAHHVMRSEEHTSELQSRSDLVCRLLLEKKKDDKTSTNY